MIQLKTFEKAAPAAQPRPEPDRRRRQAYRAWFDLFFGQAPIWVRLLVWAQRNNGH